jgi:hypothetical protein
MKLFIPERISTLGDSLTIDEKGILYMGKNIGALVGERRLLFGVHDNALYLVSHDNGKKPTIKPIGTHHYNMGNIFPVLKSVGINVPNDAFKVSFDFSLNSSEVEGMLCWKLTNPEVKNKKGAGK